VLGTIDVVVDGRAYSVGGPQAERLVGMLVTNLGSPVTVAELEDALWPEGAPPTATTAVRMQVRRLRTRLASLGVGREAIATAARGYRLAVDPDEVDVARFRAEIAEATAYQTADPEAAMRLLDAALGRWRGEPFGDHADEEWARVEAAALRELHRRAEEAWADAALAVGAAPARVDRLAAAARAEPYRERRWAQLMLALYRGGRQGEALRAFHEARNTLAEGLGVEPGRDLVALEAAMLRHDPELMRTGGSTLRLGPPVPVPPSALLGRERELAEVLDLVERNRLVTISGVGGVGKSRLAAEVALRIAEGAEAVVPASFSAVDDPTQAALALSGAVGVGPSGDPESQATAVVAHLVDERAVLLLDECERVLDSLVPLVDRLLRQARNLRVLATSRSPLGLPGEVVVPLAGLDAGAPEEPGPAARLLADRLGRSLAALDPPTVADVVAVAAALDGVPLALEVAAAHAGGLSPSEAGRLLHAAGHGAADPALPLRGAIVASVDGLDDRARRLLLRATALPAGFGVAAAAALLDESENSAAAALSTLARHGLVVPAETSAAGPRYRCLEPVRHVALELDAFGEGDRGLAAASAHLATLGLAVGDGMHQPRLDALPAFTAELPNIRSVLARTAGTTAALELSLALAGACSEAGLAVEASAWLASALPAADAGSHRWARAVVALADLPGYFAGYARLAAELRRAVDIAYAHGDDRLALFARGMLAVAVGWAGELHEAVELLDGRETRRLVGVVDDPYVTAQHRRMLGFCHLVRGEPDRGIAEQLAAADDFLSIDAPTGAVSALYSAAVVARVAGRDEEAVAALERAVALRPAGGAAATHANVRQELAHHARRRGDPTAVDQMAAAVAELERVGNLRSASTARRDLGRWLVADGRWTEGTAELLTSLPLLLDLDGSGAAVALVELAALAERQANPALAAVLVGAADAAAGSGDVALLPDERRAIDEAVARWRGAESSAFRRGGNLGADAVVELVREAFADRG
jgi:DNA-binding SARP family transcriptional activator/predicted ATPase